MAYAFPPPPIRPKKGIVYCMYERKPSGCLNPQCTFYHVNPRPDFSAQQGQQNLPGLVFHSSKVCRFESSPAGCTNPRCTFVHTKPKPQLAATACRFEGTATGCTKPDCPFQHSQPRSQFSQNQSEVVRSSAQPLASVPAQATAKSLVRPSSDKLILSEGKKSYWQKYGKAFLMKLCAKNSVVADFGEPGGIGFSGAPGAVTAVIDQLKDKTLFESELKIRKLGFASYLREESGKGVMQKHQDDFAAAIMVQERVFQVDLLSTFGIQLTIIRGDIMKQTYSSIVMPCDDFGNPFGTVGAQIKEASQIPTASLDKAQKAIAQGQNLAAIKVSETAKANTPWSLVFLCPFGGQLGGAHSRMRDVLHTVLEFANKGNNVESIVIPCFSSGTEQNDEKLKQTLMQSLVWYLVEWLLDMGKKNLKLKEIALCDMRVQTCDLWKQVLMTALRSNAQELLELTEDTFPHGQHTEDVIPHRSHRHMKRVSSSSLASAPLSNSTSVGVKIGKVTVDFVVGDIFAPPQRCDAMVNSVGTNLNLTVAGPLAQKVASLGGPKVASECSLIRMSKFMGAAVTSGGNLPYAKILHIQNSTNKADWAARLTNGFRDNSAGIRSFAVPALGSGGCGIHADQMAAVMKTILEMLPASSSIEKVLFIFQDSSTENMYRRVFQSPASIVGRTHSSVSLNDALGAGGLTRPETPIGFHEMLLFTVVSDKQSSVDAVTKKLSATAAQISKSQSVETDMVLSFGSAEISALNSLCLEFEVNIKIDTEKKTLKLDGSHVPEALIKLHGLMSDWQRGSTDLKGTGIQWLYNNPIEGWKVYSDLIAGQLEKEFKKGSSSVTLKSETGQSGSANTVFTVDFVQWKEVVVQSKVVIQELAIKRKTPNDKIPAHWDSSNDSTVVSVVPVTNQAELEKVKRPILAKNSGLNIILVERVENVALFKQYLTQKEVVEKELPFGVCAEMTLYHGTKEDVIPKINKESFNRSFAGTNVGKAYGAGNYFALDFAMSYRSYATPNSVGERKIYQAKVLTGFYTTGSSSMPTAPDRSDGKGKYHSTVNNTHSPSIFVTYLDAHAYPEYIITVK